MTRVAAIQMTSAPDVATNLREAERLLAQAAGAGARLAVLPENFAIMARSNPERLAAAEADGAGPIQEFLAAAARTHRLWLVGGTIPLRTQSEKVRATCLLYDEQGVRVARYDKIHLFDVQLANGESHFESSAFEAGDTPVVVDTPAGRLGLSVCYDVRFPELYRRLLDGGTELLSIPSAFTAYTGRAHWETLVRARAIENLSFVIAAAQSGRHPNGRETHGDTMIVNPWGEILARRAHGPGVVLADCDLAALRAFRRQLPSIEHRRMK